MQVHDPDAPDAARIPRRPTVDGLEDRWVPRWEASGIHRFDRTRDRAEVYAIDTPPPTVSGRLHIGHCFSYAHTDVIARFQRMRGREVFYPMGWDDNGLNTERRVQLLLGITCDPSLPYDPDLVTPGPTGHPTPVSRRNFIELCAGVTAELERDYHALWRRLGLSVDWEQTYTTIGHRARRVSQLGFLELLAHGHAYRDEAPTLWDVDFGTAVAQAELADREVRGAMHRLRFTGPDGATIPVDTTRPELLPACVAVVAHPDDARYRPLVGRTLTTPLFGARVPVVTHHLASPDTGTGIAMVCTFGDATDVEWWRALDLPLRPVMGRDGRILPVTWGAPGWETADAARAQRHHDALAGRTAQEARRTVVAQLRLAGALIGEPRTLTHAVKFWENGTRPLEIVTTPQWFVRTRDHAARWRERGQQVTWHPPFMQQRYADWVDGLAGDWNISRQRYFGVPFPVWYPLDGDGAPVADRPLVAEPAALPVDPTTDVPSGYTAGQRDVPGGFTAERDVMDTWATSSLTPQIAGGWPDDPDLFGRVFPMDLRPQAHEIIRTWLFTTVVRSHLHHDALPWRHAAISGFVVDPDRRKLSKSAGNADDDPMVLLRRHGADAVRYWAAGARLGSDGLLDDNRMRVGRRLATKLLNVSRFVVQAVERAGGDLHDRSPAVAHLDRAWLAALAATVTDATMALADYDHAGALRVVEDRFWAFCDDHVELVKARAYGDRGASGAASAHRALTVSLSVLQRLLAPFLPFATEEAWSWWQAPGSIHRAPWPEPGELTAAGAAEAPLVSDVARAVIARVRRAKAEAGVSLRAPVATLTVGAGPDRLAALHAASADVLDAAHAARLATPAATDLSVTVELADQPA